jgi:hypothetical protein
MGVITSISSSGGSAAATVYKSTWLTATAYIINQQIQYNNDLFICLADHTSGATTEPGIGASWDTVWARQVDSLTANAISAAAGTGTPSSSNPFVTEDTLLAHDHDGTDAAKVTWANVDKTTSSIADIATRAHTALSAIGTNTHAQIDSHVADATKHRQINDAGTSATELWSANKVNTALAAAMFGVLNYQEEPVIDKDLSTPPSPVEGARYIVKATGDGAWAGETNNIVQYITDAWVSTPAVAGMVAWVTDEDLLYLFTGNTWLPINDFVLSQTDPVEIDYDSVTAGTGTTVSKGDHSHNLAAHDHTHDEILIESTFNLEDFVHLFSAGRISGGDITDDTAGGVNISELVCLLKASEEDLAHIKYVTVVAGNIPSASLTDNALNYICVDYNDGTPIFYSTTNRLGISDYTQFILGRLYKSGTDLTIFVGGMNLPNLDRINHDRLIRRGVERMSGADIYETGTRCLGVTAGIYYFGLNKITITAKDTSDGDTFTTYRRDGSGGWIKTLNKTDLDNTKYDDGSGSTPAATLPDDTYSVKFIYLDLLGNIYALDGQGYYTLSEAKVVAVPTTVPTFISTFCKLAAKIIILKGASSFEMVVSGYESALFGTTAPSNHQGLAGLQGGAHDDYYHITNVQHTALTTNLTETIQDIAGGMVSGTDTGMTLTYDDSTGKIAGAVTYGTTEGTSCQGNDSRLSDARIPASHTIGSHTTSGAADGKVLTASSATEFGWEDPAPTWDQVTDKPTTFAPTIGTGAADAVAGNDARLTDARTPVTHTHTLAGITDYTATATWIPVLVWSGAAPIYTAVARYTITGKVVNFWLSITGNDGDGRKMTSITLPVEPKNVGMIIPLIAQNAAPTTRADPFAYIVANTDTSANKLIQFYTALTFQNNLAFSMIISGQYEVA